MPRPEVEPLLNTTSPSSRRSFLLTLWALMVKNFHLKKRSPVTLVLELVLPLIFILCFTLLKSLFSTSTIHDGWSPNDSKTPVSVFASNIFTDATTTFCMELSRIQSDLDECNAKIALAVDDRDDLPKLIGFRSWVADNFCANFNRTTRVFESSSELQDYLKSGDYGRDGRPVVAAALVFHSIGDVPNSGIGDNGNTKFEYSIRLNTSYPDCALPMAQSTKGPKVNKLQNSLSLDAMRTYTQDGFTSLQIMVDRYIIHQKRALEIWESCDNQESSSCERWYLPQNVFIAPTPIRGYTLDPFYDSVINVLSLMYLMAYLFPLFKTLAGMVEEKEMKIKEGLFIMGVPESAITLSWYLTYAIVYFATALPLTLICKFGLGSAMSGLFPNTSPVILFAFFFMFGMNVLAVCFVLSAFFSKAKVAGICGVVVFFAGYFGYYATAGLSMSAKTALCLLPQIAFALGIESMGNFESAGLGLDFSNADHVYDEFSFQISILFLFLDFVLYTMLGWYFNKVIPREWGVVLPWYFPFLTSYWCPTRVHSSNTKSQVRPTTNSDAIEGVSSELAGLKSQNRCIDIKGLVKEFDTPTGIKVAVDHLDLTMYEGQIFALLGHNGAGKTTTINMLSGMLPITSGSATVLGFDVATNMAAIRETMGVCPQHDVLYSELTVHEHLIMFGRIKGLRSPALESAVMEKIEEVGLTEKTYVMSKYLSGGQKRKLSVAIALIGDSKVVFLDEPTSGMDPYSRRFTWEVLRKNRPGRIMILTTHFMDEADLLGDRIGIMGQGQLRCCGSSLFLKNRYGQGYNLTITKLANCNQATLANTVTSRIHGARMLSDVGTELTFQLPVAEAQNFPQLLHILETEKEQLMIQEYGISITTMEEIFIRVARDGDVTAAHVSETHQMSNENAKRRASRLSESQSLPHAVSSPIVPVGQRRYASFHQQILAVYIKRVLCARRDGKAVVCSLLLPLLLAVLGLCIIKFTGDRGDDPSLVLNLKVFGDEPLNFPYNSVREAVTESAQLMSLVQNSDPFFPQLNLSRATGKLWGVQYDHGYPNISELYIPSVLSETDTLQNVIALSYFLSSGWSSEPFYGSALFPTLSFSNNTAAYLTLINTTSPHSAGIFVNVINDALARQTSGGKRSIVARNHPLPVTASTAAFFNSASAFTATLFILIAISFIPATFVSFVVRERENTRNAKHLQLLSGCEVLWYWMANYLWDLTSFIPFFISIVVLVKIFDIGPMVNHGGLFAVTCLFAGFGFASIPFSYLLSFLFISASTAQNITVLINFLVNLFLTLISFIMGLGVLSASVHDVNDILRYVYRIFPGFCVGDGLYALAFKNIVHDLGASDKEVDPWAWDVCGANFFMLIFDTVLCSVLVIVIDMIKSYPSIQAMIFRDPPPLDNSPPVTIDSDVAEEELRIDSLPVNDMVTVRRLRKVYPGGKFAVRDVQFGIPQGECFGLLGINGAGKTTTLKMLTGDVVPSAGSAYLANLNVMNQLRDVRKVVGYCPQFDALTDLLTVREHLELYCRLKGIPSHEMTGLVRQKLEQLDLLEFEHRLAHTLSGGNKRKLSVAIAMIGNPPIIFLDEPSTGMDPVARRFMWNVIAQVSTSSKECTVILTTHSMEECEALCTNVAIMVGGRFRCLGPVQRLKAKFGQGFTVEIKVAAPEGEELQPEGQSPPPVMPPVVGFSPPLNGPPPHIIRFFNEKFPDHLVVECSANHLVVRLPQTNLTVGSVFDALETHKQQLGIAEYSVSQTTLEQIFNTFASQQDEERVMAPGFVSVTLPQQTYNEMIPTRKMQSQ